MDLRELSVSFKLHLGRLNRSDRTLETYSEAIEKLARFLEENGESTEAGTITRASVVSFGQYMVQNYRPATASNRHRALTQFFKWAVEEGEVDENVMRGLKGPHVPEEPAPVLTHAELRRLFDSCKGIGFNDRRDLAIMRLFASSGIRLSELTGSKENPVTQTQVDIAARSITVLGKGARPRVCYFDEKAALALDRYIRVRSRHRLAHLDALWLGERKALTPNGVRQLVKRRGRIVGVEVHPHLFRHTFAHLFRVNGGQDTDLMRLTGWKSEAMLRRYAQSTADARARIAYARIDLGL